MAFFGFGKKKNQNEEEMIRLSNICQKKNVQILEAPITGGEHRAKSGNISILVSGKKKTFNKVFNLLSYIGHKILYFGFAFLTFSLLLGSMWARSKHGTFWSLDPLSLVRTWPLAFTWLAYGLLLVCRITRSWKGMRSAIFSMFCFVCVIFSLLSHF